MKNIIILGSTGSIGQSTLSVIKQNKQYQVFALVANSNVELVTQQCLEFEPTFVAMANHNAAQQVAEKLKLQGCATEVLAGEEAICELAAHQKVDMVMAAIVGAAGLLPTLSAIKAGKKILLANKESLVTCGKVFLDEVKRSGATLLPVDSEHNAIFQSLPVEAQRNIGFCNLADLGVSKIVLTGSGGPFRTRALDTFCDITPSEAVAHPNWSMGAKISVDSATMMNKGLEYIEARWLFNASAEQMEIIIHPQSIIHSMVRYVDGSVIAQMGNPDMRTPIAETMAYPQRIVSGVAPLDFMALSELTFMRPDFQRYPNLQLAIEAFAAGQYATTAMNAANEVAVASFLQGRIGFTQIAELNRFVVEKIPSQEIASVDDVLVVDKIARELAEDRILSF